MSWRTVAELADLKVGHPVRAELDVPVCVVRTDDDAVNGAVWTTQPSSGPAVFLCA